VFSGVSFRTSVLDFNHQHSEERIFVAVDFSVPLGEHLTAPAGKGKPLAPKFVWKNAKVLEIFWPEHVGLPDSDGKDSGFFGYTKDFTLLFALCIVDASKPVEYDLTYVSCGDACVPHMLSGKLVPNGLLLQDEIESICGPSEISGESLLIAILLGLLGGLILNCMPCVFPIISIKIFSILKTAGGSKKNIRKHGVAVSIGTISTFLILGIALLILRQSVSGIGWGFYMQCPQFVFVILLIFLLCGLHFFNVLHIRIPIHTGFLTLPIKSAYVSSFANGVFGAIASAACVGPFAGMAVASALLYGAPWQSCCIFTAIGFGAATPFILMAIFPACTSIFPKPGKWLSIFKEFMGFAMLFSCTWPIWTLTTQISIENLMMVLISLIATSMFAWILSQSKKFSISTVIAVAGLGCSFGYGLLATINGGEAIDEINWEEFTDEKFDNAISEKKPIFLNFTASWCMNCQFNQRIFRDPEVVDAFKKNNVVAMKCDWSRRDERVTRLLKKYGAAAVPLYVYHSFGYENFKILPNILTKNCVLEEINEQSNKK
jgi:thiol:disulfide interchange protein DsbD